MHSFKAVIQIIGINPYVTVPDRILQKIFKQAAKDKGHIPVTGIVNEKTFKQTLVKYNGVWRLYINTTMLPHSPKKVGEKIAITIAFDPEDRSIPPHPELNKALAKNKKAREAFNQLPSSRQKEITRYISSLKTDASVERNIKRAINFLTGRERFIGRDKP